MQPNLPDQPNDLLRNDEAVSRLKNIVFTHIDSSVDAEKTEQYYEIRRNELYYNGQQYSVPGINSSGFVDYIPTGVSNLSPASSQTADFSEDDVTNIYKGDTRKFVSIIGQRPPNINCTAAISDNHEHQVRARIADTIAPLLYELWDTQYSHMRVAYSIAVKGTTFIYTPFVTDGDKYGHTEIPQYSESSMEIGPPAYSCPSCGSEGVMPPDPFGAEEAACPDCGDPNVSIEAPPTTSIMQEMGSERFANGSVECHVLSGLEITTPFHITDISEAPWLRYEIEYDRHKLMTAYPHIAEKIRNSSGGGGTTSEYGRNVREQTSSYSKRNYNTNRTNKIRYARYWIRPSEYAFWSPNEIISIQSQTTLSEALGDESLQAAGRVAYGNSVSMEQVAFSHYLREHYPDGIKLTFVGEHLADIESESMDDVIAAIPPEAAETMYPRAYLEDAIALQDRVNDYTEIAHESAERSIPFIIANPNVLNPKTINRLGRRVSEFVFSEPGSGGNFGNAFYKFSPSEVRNDLMDFANQNITLSREIYGITDAIFGGGPSHATLGEAEIDRNQALMILGSPWFFMRRGWARAFRNGIMQVARKSAGVLHFPKHSDYHSEGVPLPAGYESLAAGGWKCEADEAMPLSAAQLRTWLERMFQLDPALGDRLGMFHPDNLGRMQDVIGVSGWAIPENKDRLAVLDVIERLSQQAPVPLPDPMTGQTIPQSSEPPDPYLHEPGLASRFIRDWLLSDDGKSLQQENPEGWQNVFLYGKSLYEMTLPPPPPPEEGGPPPGPVGELPPPEEMIPETAIPPAEAPMLSPEEQLMIQ